MRAASLLPKTIDLTFCCIVIVINIIIIIILLMLSKGQTPGSLSLRRIIAKISRCTAAVADLGGPGDPGSPPPPIDPQFWGPNLSHQSPPLLMRCAGSNLAWAPALHKSWNPHLHWTQLVNYGSRDLLISHLWWDVQCTFASTTLLSTVTVGPE